MFDRSWISTVEFAGIANLNRRVASRLLARVNAGNKALWHGYALETRCLDGGRGGKSGRQYLVKVSSLPPHLQDRLKAFQTPVEGRSIPMTGSAAQQERNWWLHVLGPALEHPKGSASRKAALAEITAKPVLDWHGRRIPLTVRTLQRKLSRMEGEGGGIGPLARYGRSDKGEKRVLISRAWDDAVPFDDAMKAGIRDDLKQYVRSLIKGGSQFKQTRVLVSDKLKEISAAYGFSTSVAAVFSIPKQFIHDEQRYKAVYRHKHDRKASEDDRPRIARTPAGLVPMQVVVMDVHHINVLVRREDGSTATPKLLAFHDIATNRVFWEIIFFERRGGVRNSDIITAFVRMCQHPAFGVPQFLYADNGSEYRFADHLEDALKLGTQLVAFHGPDDRNRVLRATPYNASAKHVEGVFRQLNQQHFRHFPGWIDDDRMNPKRPAMGKLPAPFDQGFDALVAMVDSHLTAYEHMPQTGALKGKSPAMAFKAHVDAGWRATILDANQLLTVFTKQETRIVRQHGIDVKGGDSWTCDGLLEYFGRKVVVHIPKFHGFAELLVTDGHGNEIGIAVRDTPYNVLDQRGAKESARRVKVRNLALAKLDKSVPDIDVGGELIAYGQRQMPVVPNEPDGTISVNRSGTERRALLPVPAAGKSRQQREDEQRIIDEARSALVSAASTINRRAS